MKDCYMVASLESFRVYPSSEHIEVHFKWSGHMSASLLLLATDIKQLLRGKTVGGTTTNLRLGEGRLHLTLRRGEESCDEYVLLTSTPMYNTFCQLVEELS